MGRSIRTHRSELGSGHTVTWADDDGLLRVSEVVNPDGSTVSFPGGPLLGECVAQGLDPAVVQSLITGWAGYRELWKGPWIYATQATYVALDSTRGYMVTATRCPGINCLPLVTVADRRIAEHDNPSTLGPCAWSGVRVITDVTPVHGPPTPPPADPDDLADRTPTAVADPAPPTDNPESPPNPTPPAPPDAA